MICVRRWTYSVRGSTHLVKERSTRLARHVEHRKQDGFLECIGAESRSARGVRLPVGPPLAPSGGVIAELLARAPQKAALRLAPRLGREIVGGSLEQRRDDAV